MKLEINHRKENGKSTNACRLNTVALENQRAMRKQRGNHKIPQDKNGMQQKWFKKGSFRIVTAGLPHTRKIHYTNLTFQLNELGKEKE